METTGNQMSDFQAGMIDAKSLKLLKRGIGERGQLLKWIINGTVRV